MSAKGHSFTVSDNEDDPFEKAVKSTGCYDNHVQVQECMFNNRDWRMCQKEVQLFKKCMIEYLAQKQQQKVN